MLVGTTQLDKRVAAVETSNVHFTAATEWAAPLVAYAESHSSCALAVMIALPLLIALCSGSVGSLVEAFVLGLLVFSAAGQGETVFALLVSGMATLVAINGFRRRRNERTQLQIQKDIRDLHTSVDEFLGALERRAKHLDFALAAATPIRDPSENEHDAAPKRLHNGSADSLF
ncbi:hypothetical protein [Ensifer aridi]|uniref:hypothetical protein n=1 Tax=Ensifer aridi TaxID=1708715 RepID=UPI00111C2E71|nr:hypothetical protein [Ensifer aridi]